MKLKKSKQKKIQVNMVYEDIYPINPIIKNHDQYILSWQDN
jgi:hypothetical protein